MDWAGWALFGLVATAILTIVMMAAQLAGLTRMDLPLILGTVVTEDPDRARVEAAHLFEQLLALASPVGLCGEEMDPATHAHLGNYPQALTHAALVQAALALRDTLPVCG